MYVIYEKFKNLDILLLNNLENMKLTMYFLNLYIVLIKKYNI